MLQSKKLFTTPLAFILCFFLFGLQLKAENFVVAQESSYYVNSETLGATPSGGDTIFVSSDRTSALKFENLIGSPEAPIVIINQDGQVDIDDPNSWGAITFENCRHIKITGTGSENFTYGFLLGAQTSGLSFTELSSDCEAEFVRVNHTGFFGIYAKKDYNGNPPDPAPVFENLLLHDCFVENVVEGMYLGETVSDGMQFRGVKIYNNIVRNTGRESLQIANMTDDVEIHHNTFLDAGMDNELYQNNIVQIGDNSVANVYNNILSGAPGLGIIVLGKGTNVFTNNYIRDSQGVFIDNRMFSDSARPTVFSCNCFVDVLGDQIIKNQNEVNFIILNNNDYNGALPFFVNNSGNETNSLLSNNKNKAVQELNFVDPLADNYALDETSKSVFQDLGATGGPVLKEFKEEYPIEPEQIILTPNMIVDQVEGGSINSVELLMDEQTKTPQSGEHPTSDSWKPYWNSTQAPYSFYIDLKSRYLITSLALHDMHNVANIEIEYGKPDAWKPLLIESLDRYNAWQEHVPDIKTRYLRFTMKETVNASFNEIVLFGIRNKLLNELKGTTVLTGEVDNVLEINTALVPTIELRENPVTTNLKLQIQDESNKPFQVEIFNQFGTRIVSKEYSNVLYNGEGLLDMNVLPFNLDPGLYMVRYISSNGYPTTQKFLVQE